MKSNLERNTTLGSKVGSINFHVKGNRDGSEDAQAMKASLIPHKKLATDDGGWWMVRTSYAGFVDPSQAMNLYHVLEY